MQRRVDAIVDLTHDQGPAQDLQHSQTVQYYQILDITNQIQGAIREHRSQQEKRTRRAPARRAQQWLAPLLCLEILFRIEGFLLTDLPFKLVAVSKRHQAMYYSSSSSLYILRSSYNAYLHLRNYARYLNARVNPTTLLDLLCAAFGRCVANNRVNRSNTRLLLQVMMEQLCPTVTGHVLSVFPDWLDFWISPFVLPRFALGLGHWSFLLYAPHDCEEFDIAKFVHAMLSDASSPMWSEEKFLALLDALASPEYGLYRCISSYREPRSWVASVMTSAVSQLHQASILSDERARHATRMIYRQMGDLMGFAAAFRVDYPYESFFASLTSADAAGGARVYTANQYATRFHDLDYSLVVLGIRLFPINRWPNLKCISWLTLMSCFTASPQTLLEFTMNDPAKSADIRRYWSNLFQYLLTGPDVSHTFFQSVREAVYRMVAYAPTQSLPANVFALWNRLFTNQHASPQLADDRYIRLLFHLVRQPYGSFDELQQFGEWCVHVSSMTDSPSIYWVADASEVECVVRPELLRSRIAGLLLLMEDGWPWSTAVGADCTLSEPQLRRLIKFITAKSFLLDAASSHACVGDWVRLRALVFPNLSRLEPRPHPTDGGSLDDTVVYESGRALLGDDVADEDDPTTPPPPPPVYLITEQQGDDMLVAEVNPDIIMPLDVFALLDA